MVRYSPSKLWVESLPDFKLRTVEYQSKAPDPKEHKHSHQNKPNHDYLFEWRCTCTSNSLTNPTEEDIKAYKSNRSSNVEKSKTYDNIKPKQKQDIKTEQLERGHNFTKSIKQQNNKEYNYRYDKSEKDKDEKKGYQWMKCCKSKTVTSKTTTQQVNHAKPLLTEIERSRNIADRKWNDILFKEQVPEKEHISENKSSDKKLDHRLCSLHKTLENNKSVDKINIHKTEGKLCCRHEESQSRENSTIKNFLNTNEKKDLTAHSQPVRNETVNKKDISATTHTLGAQKQCYASNACNKEHFRQIQVKDSNEKKKISDDDVVKMNQTASTVKTVTINKQFKTNTDEIKKQGSNSSPCYYFVTSAKKNCDQNFNHVHSKCIPKEKTTYICAHHSKMSIPNNTTKSDSMQVLCSASYNNEVLTTAKESKKCAQETFVVSQSHIENLEEQYTTLEEKYQTLSDARHNCAKCKQTLILKLLLLKRKIEMIKCPKDQSLYAHTCEKHRLRR